MGKLPFYRNDYSYHLFWASIFLLILPAFFLPFSSEAASDWTFKEILELKERYAYPNFYLEITDLEFISETKGWMIVRGEISPNNIESTVWQTTDGGHTWSIVFEDPDPGGPGGLIKSEYRDMAFDKLGVGDLGIGVIHRVTTNYDAPLCLVGFCCNEQVLVTTDYGFNWDKLCIPDHVSSIAAVEVVWPGIWAVSSDSKLLFSYGGGEWESVISPTSEPLFRDIYVEPGAGSWALISGFKRFFTNQPFAISPNWTNFSYLIPFMDKVDFLAMNGVGIANLFPPWTIYYSNNPIVGWTEATVPEELDPYDVDMVNGTKGEGYVAGRNLSVGGIEGKIYKTIDYGKSWTIDLETSDLVQIPYLRTVSTIGEGGSTRAVYAAGAGYYLFKYTDTVGCNLPDDHVHYCQECGPCGVGEGDCDGDSQCKFGLVCAQDVGLDYGMPENWDVCEQPGGGS